MWGLLIPLLAQLPGLFGALFKPKNDILQAQNAANLQIALSKIELAKDIAQAQVAAAGEASTVVNSTGFNFKYFTFFMWFGPFMAGVVAPNFSKMIFSNLSTMPDWYVKSCMVIMFTVWGISVSADTVANIFSGLSNFLADRRTHALEMAKVDRESYFNALRSLKGVVTPQDVKIGDQIMDKMDQANEASGQ